MHITSTNSFFQMECLRPKVLWDDSAHKLLTGAPSLSC